VIVAFALVALFASVTLIGWCIMQSGTSVAARYTENLTRHTESRLQGLFVFANTRRLLWAYVASLVLGPIVCWYLFQTPVAAIVLAVLLLMSPRFVLNKLRVRRRKQIERSLPDKLAQIAGAMRAGLTFTSAIQSTVHDQRDPLSQEFSLLLREHRLGARLEEALDNLGERVDSEEMDLVISATLIAQDVGGNLAEVLQRLSDTIRRKLEMEGKIAALTSQGVLQGRFVTALPIIILAYLLVKEHDAMMPMLTGLLGWIFLGSMSVLLFVGHIMISRIVRIKI